MPSPEKLERNQEIVRRILTGESYDSIGKDFEISRQAVGAIAKRYGVSSFPDIKNNSDLDDIDYVSNRGIHRIVYPALRKHFQKKCNSMVDVANAINENSNSSGSLCRFLYGKTDFVSIVTLKKILEYTKMDFDTAFQR